MKCTRQRNGVTPAMLQHTPDGSYTPTLGLPCVLGRRELAIWVKEMKIQKISREMGNLEQVINNYLIWS